MNAIWLHQPHSRKGRERLGYAVPVTVVRLLPNTARIRYRRWDGKLVFRFVKRCRLRLQEGVYA